MDSRAVFDNQFLAVGEDCRRDVAAREALAHEVGLARELDAVVGVHPPDEGDPATGQGQVEPTLAIPIRGQREGRGQGPEVRLVQLKPPTRITGPVLGGPQGPMGLAEG